MTNNSDEKPNDKDIDRQKKDAEIKKLCLEIKELEKESKRPFWRKPAVFTAVFSGIIAISTVGVEITTGYFEDKAHIAEIRIEQAETRLKELRKTQQAVRESAIYITQREAALKDREQTAQQRGNALAQTEADATRRSAELEDKDQAALQRESELAQKEADSTKRLAELANKEQAARQRATDLEQREENFSKRQVHLKGEEQKLSKLEVKLKEREKEIESELQGPLAGLRTHINVLTSDSSYRVSPFDDAAKIIVEILRSTHNSSEGDIAVSRVSEALDESSESDVRGTLLHILYTGTRNSIWKNQLFEMARKECPNNPYFCRIFSIGRWPEDSLIELLKTLAEILDSTDRNIHRSAYLIAPFKRLVDSPTVAAQVRTTYWYLDVVVRARDIALDHTIQNSLRSASFDGLAGLAPRAALVVAAAIITSGNAQSGLLAQLQFTFEHRYPEHELLEQLGIPDAAEVEAWRSWLDSLPSDTIDFIVAGTAAEWRKDPDRLQNPF